MAYSVFRKCVHGVSRTLDSVACLALFSMMALTCVDVFMRYVFNNPIVGVYDIVSLLAVVTVAFALPFSMLNTVHVAVQIFVMHLSKRVQIVLEIFTHVLGLLFFLILAWQTFILSGHMQNANEVTPTLQISFHPLIYCASVCFLLLCVAILVNLIDTLVSKR